jgi:LmbE family N-acetylglucosaminyl deacetylase
MNVSIASQSPLANPKLLPLRSVEQDTIGSALVVAPHPDDETLGCGGVISLLRDLGQSVRVLVISGGTLSHPRSFKYPAAKLLALREAETLEALAILGVSSTETTFLRWQDGSIPTSESPDFQAAVAQCYGLLKMWMPETVFLPWRSDPHPDHRATWQLIRMALSDLKSSPRLIEYPIWDWDPDQRGNHSTNGQQFVAWRFDITSVRKKKLKAIAAYRSQTTNLIDDDPEGFRLTPTMLSNFTRPWEMYLEEAQ